MNKKAIIAFSTFFALSITANTTIASSWLDSGLDIIKKQTEEKETTTASSSSTEVNSNVTSNEISEAFKEALLIGSEEVVSRLGQLNGFNDDTNIHIPLPKNIQTAKTLLDKAGLSSLTSDLELKLNRAAEAATPKAKDLFIDAISEMSFEDVMAIYQGPNDSATTYFKEKMTPALTTEMQPIVEETLSEVGAIQAYDSFLGEYKDIPFVPDLKTDLNSYVVEKGMDGIFYYLAEKEAAIRENPVQQTTDLLKKVFGSN